MFLQTNKYLQNCLFSWLPEMFPGLAVATHSGEYRTNGCMQFPICLHIRSIHNRLSNQIRFVTVMCIHLVSYTHYITVVNGFILRYCCIRFKSSHNFFLNKGENILWWRVIPAVIYCLIKLVRFWQLISLLSRPK